MKSRDYCARCHLPLDRDGYLDPAARRGSAELCDDCSREHLGEGRLRLKVGIHRWPGARLARARARGDISSRALARWARVAHTTVLRNEQRERLSAYLTRRLVRLPVYSFLAALTAGEAGGPG